MDVDWLAFSPRTGVTSTRTCSQPRAVDLLLDSLESVDVDTKKVDDDRFDDLSTVDNVGCHQRLQFKHRDNNDQPLSLATFVSDTRVLRHKADETTSTESVGGLCVFIGATPSTQWLDGQLAVDEHGFVLTGADIPVARHGSVEQAPLLLETSRSAIFCVGDVRSRSVKRVATAIGEGSVAVRLVFDRLQVTGMAVADPPRTS